jgi:hypothetical protein
MSASGRWWWLVLAALAGVAPDLWLPAVPVHGQNANLYDDDWARVLEQNRQLFPAGPPGNEG